MERAAVRRRDRLILEARDEVRALGRTPTAGEIDAKVALKDPALHVKWKAAQDAAHRRKTILQVLRDERRPTTKAAVRPSEVARKPEPEPLPPPPLVWPVGMRQRKEREPKFKLPFLLANTGGSERLFLEGIGDGVLHELSVVLDGQKVGYLPALRPGAFIEVEWVRAPEVNRIATWNGWRGDILAQENNRDAVEALKPSPQMEVIKPLYEFMVQRVIDVERVMPKDLEKWKHQQHRFRLEVSYIFGSGNLLGGLKGFVFLDMERLWFGFKDEKGNQTPIR